jgi:hypothetical protein
LPRLQPTGTRGLNPLTHLAGPQWVKVYAVVKDCRLTIATDTPEQNGAAPLAGCGEGGLRLHPGA